jgi:hypothetical protein
VLNRVGTWFRRQSVGRKLTTTALTTSGVALLAACAVFAIHDYLNLRARLVRDVTLLADTNSTAALTFGDATAAAQMMGATSINEHILSARLFTADGTLLATYTRPGLAPSLDLASPGATRPATDAVIQFEGAACASSGRSR